MKAIIYVIALMQLFLSVSAFSAVTDFFTDEKIKDFEKGKFKNISLDRNGYLSLSPNIKEVFKKEDILFVWTIVQDSDGNSYFGTGNKPRIYRETPEGKVELYYESETGTSINSIKIDRNNNLYAAVNPIGKIVKIKSSGVVDEDYAGIQESYIWDMDLDSKDNLYVATGKSAAIYKVSSKDNVEKLYEASDEGHFLCMAMNKKDILYFGSEGKGNLYSMNTANKKVKVLFDSYEDEIKDIAIDRIGNVYFATATKIAKRPPKTFDYTDSFVLYGASSTREKSKKGRPLPKKIPLKNSIYKIDPNGEVKKLLTRDETVFLSIALDEKGVLFAGSGDNGIVYKVNSVNNAAIFIDSKELQILSLISNKGNILAATGNLGKVLKIGLSSTDTGVYTSRVFDAKGKAIWGKISWDSENDDQKIFLQTRSGNTILPDKTWSSWSRAYKNDEGEVVRSEPGQYIQYRATIPADSDKSPLLKKVMIAYLLENRPPQVEKLKLKKETTKRLTLQGPFNKILKPSVYSLSWMAMDLDKDYLTYSIYYRDELEDQFILLKEGIHKKKYSFDSRRIPDGTYIFRVEASDEKSNGEERRKTGFSESTVYKIDNSPPAIYDVDIKKGIQGYVITGKAKDDLSIIKVIQYSVNGQDWIYLSPTDLIYDSKEESFEFHINSVKVPLLKGKNSIIFRVADSFDNFTTQEAQFNNNKRID